jgi:penicillin-binding protein 2
MHLRIKLVLLVALSLSMASLLMMRALDVQVSRGVSFKAQADDNRFFTLPIIAERGVLLDRYGQPLVRNSRRYYRVINPTALHYTTEPISREVALAEMATQSGSVITQPERIYPFSQALSHILGYVGSVTAEDLVDNPGLDITDTIGKLGLEILYDRQLRGVSGREEYEINALGQRQKQVSLEPAQPGQNVTTTVDPYLSQVAFQALGNKTGVVGILDAESGEVLALVSNPTFDPNILTRASLDPDQERQRQQAVQALFKDPRQLFFNRAINGQYPPGSVFKLITALAGLEEKKIDLTTTVMDEGVLKVGEYEYGNWFFRQYGRTEGEVGVVKSLARSNDIFFYKVAEWVGPDRLATMARIFGLGQVTGIGLTPEAKGLVPDPIWKEEHLGERWFLGNTYHFGIGQGDLLVSPLQIAQVVQAIAHHGTLCQPSLVKTGKKQCREVGVHEENLSPVLTGMLDACSPGGTAFPFFPYNETRRGGATPYEDLTKGAVACKTGTAEFGATINAEGHRKTHGWFVAIKEVNKEQLLASQLPGEWSLPVASGSATPVSAGTLSAKTPQQLRQEWLLKVKDKGFPQRLVFVTLVESSDEVPFTEGSRDAGPIVKQIIEWIEGVTVPAQG